MDKEELNSEEYDPFDDEELYKADEEFNKIIKKRYNPDALDEDNIDDPIEIEFD